eukprot:79809-Pleurochrysis_carterae.AAC.1
MKSVCRDEPMLGADVDRTSREWFVPGRQFTLTQGTAHAPLTAVNAAPHTAQGILGARLEAGLFANHSKLRHKEHRGPVGARLRPEATPLVGRGQIVARSFRRGVCRAS